MKYLLDTNICIYFLKGRFNLVEKFGQIGFENLYISEITLAELKFGAEKSEFPTKNREIINEFTNLIKLIPIFKAIDIFAKEKARLRKTGRVVDDFDLLIGSSAIVNNMVLVTNNEKHFIDLVGITFENWTKV
ncbi:type II toxin-antitoxin system VapC family toxin [Mongoliitalea daihaiensis]|uniref:type II toxin-antitoxin system VapC family toxin n=1 Tax=Mongoliitalea daihaiensis TaxID=2782006 RepID=UPI001F25D67E|nr:type II toxin-antitoxin system VapC family toxin [Mongoliitalea daihaiensis]UJP65354.1 type II toxin-antitoxin system VapC family toxin [Mongoliitalea daihaiensis]